MSVFMKTINLISISFLITFFSYGQTAMDYYNEGIKQGEKENHKEAIILFSKVISISQEYVLAYDARATAKLKLGDYRGAIADYNKIIEMVPESYRSYFRRATAKMQINEFKGAIADFNKAIELNPNFGEAFLHRGLLKIKFDFTDSGCLDLSKAGELGYEQAYDFIKEYCNE